MLGYERFLRAFAWFKVATLRWDRRESDFLHFLTRIPRDGVIIDVGANLGFLCVHLARRVAGGAVIAFEPLPDNRRTLSWMIGRFGLRNVTVYPCAVGESHGTVSMVLPVHGKAREQGLGHIVDPADSPEPGVCFEVPLRPLDEVMEAHHPGVRVSGIKIDVENFERFVLRGARRILERDRPLVYLELWDGLNRQESFALARELGYEIFVYYEGALVSFDPQLHRGHGNFFFVPGANASATGLRAEPAHALDATASTQPLHHAVAAVPPES